VKYYDKSNKKMDSIVDIHTDCCLKNSSLSGKLEAKLLQKRIKKDLCEKNNNNCCKKGNPAFNLPEISIYKNNAFFIETSGTMVFF